MYEERMCMSKLNKGCNYSRQKHEVEEMSDKVEDNRFEELLRTG